MRMQSGTGVTGASQKSDHSLKGRPILWSDESEFYLLHALLCTCGAGCPYAGNPAQAYFSQLSTVSMTRGLYSGTGPFLQKA